MWRVFPQARIIASLLTGVVALTVPSGSALAGAKWREAAQVFAANAAPRGERTFTRGQEVVRLPLLWEHAVELDRDVDFAVGGEIGTLARGTVLPLVKFSIVGDGSDVVDIFCTPRRAGERALEGGMMGAMFGGVATRALVRSLTDSQRCLQDSDGDGLFDRTLVVGEGNNDYLLGPSLTPIAFQIRENVPVSEEDDAVVVTLRTVRRNSVHFLVDLVQQGKSRNFDTVTDGNYGTSRQLPFDASADATRSWRIYGMDLRLVEHNVSAGSVTLEFPTEVDAERYPSIPDRWQQIVTYLSY
ncbi:hypothetical protein M3P36_00840 [Altererythrobacter sp. KTW20L]|uniref:hypothetical protein n=1 Tax=Altererythrobacter sp. KTW20L TaxID=2942210 RepID=UPI0020C0C3F2|nr:hypothetical protein [Altererythrobacter sp. KTW20L]MCL6249596.1 hypothetical protein [Altererythrobacter sp. KTW20L]